MVDGSCKLSIANTVAESTQICPRRDFILYHVYQKIIITVEDCQKANNERDTSKHFIANTVEV